MNKRKLQKLYKIFLLLLLLISFSVFGQTTAEWFAKEAGIKEEDFSSIVSFMDKQSVHHVDDLFNNTPHDGNEIPGWDKLSPSIKVALFAKRTATVDKENGQLFLALLTQSLADDYPSIRYEPNLVDYLNYNTSGKKLKWPKSQAKTIEIPEWAAEPVLTLISYVSNNGSISVAEMAHLSPLTSTNSVEIIANSKTDQEALEGIVRATHDHYITVKKFTEEQARLKTRQFVSSCAKAVADVYDTANYDPVINNWKNGPPPDPKYPSTIDPSPSKFKPTPPGGTALILRGGSEELFDSSIGIVAKGTHYLIPVGPPNSSGKATKEKTSPKPASSTKKSAKELIKSPALFREAGGIMFDGEAVPCEGMKTSNVTLDYDKTQPDGKRLIVKTDEISTSISLKDDEISAIAHFSNDKNFIVANMSATLPTEKWEDKYKRKAYGNITVATLNPAFKDTLLGYKLLRADSMIFGLIERSTRWDTGTKYITTETLDKKLNKLNEIDKSYNTSNPNIVNTNDITSKASFCLKDKIFTIDGLPTINFFKKDKKGNPLEEIKLSETVTKNQNIFNTIDQEAYNSLLQVFRMSNFFRYFIKHNNKMWKDFFSQVKDLPKTTDKYRTPDIVCNCSRNAIDKWLKSLGVNN